MIAISNDKRRCRHLSDASSADEESQMESDQASYEAVAALPLVLEAVSSARC